MMREVLAAVRGVFEGVAEAVPFLADWPEIGILREVTPDPLPVCRWIAGMSGSGDIAAVMTAVRTAASRLQWRQTYEAGDFGAGFLDGYGWSEFIGLRGPVPSTRIASGVLLLGPGVTYPSHAHAAEEVYLPIHGVAEWQCGGGDFVPVSVGQAIHHAPWVPHAMRVGAQPLAALYLWRGGDLAAKSVILASPASGPW